MILEKYETSVHLFKKMSSATIDLCLSSFESFEFPFSSLWNIYRGHLLWPLSCLTALEEHEPDEENYDYTNELGDDMITGAMSHPTS